MEKRQLILNDFMTADYGFTLASLKITKASQVQNFVSVPGRFAPLDLSTALTDGEPYYGSASLEAVLESSQGTREERNVTIMRMIQLLDGHNVRIELPDWPDCYMTGRVQILPEYSDLVHCRVKVSAVCEPWLYVNEETVVSVVATTVGYKSVELTNSGRMGVAPTVKVEDNGSAEITLEIGTNSVTLGEGTHQVPMLYMKGGESLVVRYRGTGTVTFTYREAVLAG